MTARQFVLITLTMPFVIIGFVGQVVWDAIQTGRFGAIRMLEGLFNDATTRTPE